MGNVIRSLEPMQQCLNDIDVLHSCDCLDSDSIDKLAENVLG